MIMKNRNKTIVLMITLTLGLPLFAADADQGYFDIPLKDVLTEEVFTISDFNGRTVLLETFAVWCPTCKRQQKEIAVLLEQIDENIVVISLDVDPNESEKQVKDHAEKLGHDWYHAISPPELTQLLIRQFGTAVVVAPSAPVIIIDKAGQARLLKRGVKTAKQLARELEGAN
jgi:peroxiredoxin